MRLRTLAIGTFTIFCLLLLFPPAALAQDRTDDPPTTNPLRFSWTEMQAIQNYFSNPDNIAALSPAMQKYLETNRNLPVSLSRDKPLETRYAGLIRPVPRKLLDQLSLPGKGSRAVLVGANAVFLQGKQNTVRDYVRVFRPTRRPRR